MEWGRAVFYLLLLLPGMVGRTHLLDARPGGAERLIVASLRGDDRHAGALRGHNPEAAGSRIWQTGNYIQRQVERWTKHIARPRPMICRGEKLIEGLPSTLAGTDSRIDCHGDYRSDNPSTHRMRRGGLGVGLGNWPTIGEYAADSLAAMSWAMYPCEGDPACRSRSRSSRF